MNRTSLSMIALALAAILFVAVNVLAGAGLRDTRLDLTADRLYTLSPGTRNVLAAIPEPITLTLYFSERLAGDVPALRVYGQRVRELLEAYAATSGGKIRLRMVDPEPFSDAEDRAVEAGARGVPLDGVSGRQFYFALVGTGGTDQREVIPFFQQDRETFLEYDLTRMVWALTDPKKPVVAILTDMPLEYGPGGIMAAMRGASRPYAILSQLKALFDVRLLKPENAVIADDVSVLVVARPKNWPDATLQAIDQYVLKGGHAVVFVDPFAESDLATTPDGRPDPDASHTATLPRLFEAWGLAMDGTRVVADPSLAISASTGEAGRRRAIPYPVWLALGVGERDAGDVVTADLGTVNIASAGALKRADKAEITLTPLLVTSKAGQLLDADLLAGRPDPERVLAALQPGGPGGPGGEIQVLAARVTGTLRTAFPDGPAAMLKRGAKPANLIVVADTDLLEDRFWVEERGALGERALTPFAGNGDFVINAVENLSGSVDLISLRGRAGSARPFLVVDALRREAGERVNARERALRQELEETERRIAELQRITKDPAKGSGGALVSAEEQAAVDRFRGQVLAIRKELREVQHTLNRDIERLSTTVKALDILAVPVLVAGLAGALAGWRRQRRAAPRRD